MSISSKIQSLITAANSVTGESRTDLTAAVQDLKDGYGQGGGGDFEVISQTAGELKKHLAAYSIDSLSLLNSFPALRNYVYFLPCKSTDNTTLDRVYLTNYAAQTAWDYSSVFSKGQMTPIATADTKASFNVNDYQINAVGTTTFTANRTIGADYVGETFSITISNSGESDITVNCIRFNKFLQGLQSNGSTYKYVLLYSYYLDSAITIVAGGSQQITIELRKTVGN